MLVVFAWLASAVVALDFGLYLRHRDRRRVTQGRIDWRRLTPLQLAYSCLLAYPFCVVYVLIDRALA